MGGRGRRAGRRVPRPTQVENTPSNIRRRPVAGLPGPSLARRFDPPAFHPLCARRQGRPLALLAVAPESQCRRTVLPPPTIPGVHDSNVEIEQQRFSPLSQRHHDRHNETAAPCIQIAPGDASTTRAWPIRESTDPTCELGALSGRFL